MTYATFDPLVDELAGLVSPSDVEWVARIMLFEHTWARRLSDALADAGGRLVMAERIPRRAIEELTAQAAAA